MGQLLALKDFALSEKSKGLLDPRWYFADAQFDMGNGGGWYYRIDAQKSFPVRLGIHQDIIDQPRYGGTNADLMVEIQKFVTRNCVGNVLCTSIDMPYSYVYRTREYDREKKYQRDIRHGYTVFNFEEADDAVLFSIKFSEYISEISPRHPDYSEVTEESILEALDGKFFLDRW